MFTQISSHADSSFSFCIKYYSARYHFPLVCICICDHEVIQNKLTPVRIHYFNKAQYLHNSLSLTLTPVWGASHIQKRVIFLWFACFALHPSPWCLCSLKSMENPEDALMLWSSLTVSISLVLLQREPVLSTCALLLPSQALTGN